MKLRTLSTAVLAVLVLSGCGAALTHYVRPETPWDTIRRVAIVPFRLTSENAVRRDQVTQLFATELRSRNWEEVVEVESSTSFGLIAKTPIEKIASDHQVDGVFTGTIDQTQGTSVQINLHDAATGELLWSVNYLLSVGPEFFSPKTPQQKLQRAFQAIVVDLERARRSSFSG